VSRQVGVCLQIYMRHNVTLGGFFSAVMTTSTVEWVSNGHPNTYQEFMDAKCNPRLFNEIWIRRRVSWIQLNNTAVTGRPISEAKFGAQDKCVESSAYSKRRLMFSCTKEYFQVLWEIVTSGRGRNFFPYFLAFISLWTTSFARKLPQGFVTLMAMTSGIIAGEFEWVLFVIQLNIGGNWYDNVP
jgi:hypothetical protein